MCRCICSCSPLATLLRREGWICRLRFWWAGVGHPRIPAIDAARVCDSRALDHDPYADLHLHLFRRLPVCVARISAASVHLVLFAMVVRLFSLQRTRDHYMLAVLSFLMVLAARSHGWQPVPVPFAFFLLVASSPLC